MRRKGRVRRRRRPSVIPQRGNFPFYTVEHVHTQLLYELSWGIFLSIEKVSQRVWGVRESEASHSRSSRGSGDGKLVDWTSLGRWNTTWGGGGVVVVGGRGGPWVWRDLGCLPCELCVGIKGLMKCLLQARGDRHWGERPEWLSQGWWCWGGPDEICTKVRLRSFNYTYQLTIKERQAII